MLMLITKGKGDPKTTFAYRSLCMQQGYSWQGKARLIKAVKAAMIDFLAVNVICELAEWGSCVSGGLPSTHLTCSEVTMFEEEMEV
ncbi:hypothetical protein J6590_045632 [Homalodisca vitripennis]|nr:hypothetical protein J6590_045632 [Homalodisca vitripennis]